MHVDIDYWDGSGQEFYAQGNIASEDGTQVADWCYYAKDGDVDVWFEEDYDFWDALTKRERDFLEAMVKAEVTKFAKEQEELEDYSLEVMGP